MAPTIRHTGSCHEDETYAVDFFGEELIVTVTPNPSEISRWIHNVVSDHNNHHSTDPLVVGVGVQWYAPPYTTSVISNYSPDRDSDDDSDSPLTCYYSDNEADTLQLCVGNRCLIIQLSGCDRVANTLQNFVENDDITFVGIWNSQDARRLARGKHRLQIDLVDIRKFLGKRLRRFSFEVIVRYCMGYEGVRLDPDISMSNWNACYLRHDQVLQASMKAYVCCKLGLLARVWEV